MPEAPLLPNDTRPIDLEQIARRIVALAETAVAEHQAAVARSQADRLMQLVRDDTLPPADPRRWR